MAEVGRLPFAHIPLQVSRAVVPRYRTGFSRSLWLVVLCLIRYLLNEVAHLALQYDSGLRVVEVPPWRRTCEDRHRPEGSGAVYWMPLEAAQPEPPPCMHGSPTCPVVALVHRSD
jgi:hypothetical protein